MFDFIRFASKNAKTIVVVLVFIASVFILVGSLASKSEEFSGIVTAIGYIAQSVLRGGAG